jgi:cyclopropane-fatty-acyl-phospholipid synthase
MPGEAVLTSWMEHDLLPDALIRVGIRRLLKSRLNDERKAGEAGQRAFVKSLRESPVAIETATANRQHYEVPAEFYVRALGPHRKYSCGFWNSPDTTLEESETAMLKLTCDRAGIADGQDILELGCGWGSLSLWMASRYANSRIFAISNSTSQKRFIDREAARRGIFNLEIVTCDMNTFHTERRFDRIVSVEMFEHMRNYRELFRRIAAFARPDAWFFVHVFSHREFAYPFEDCGAADWMARHFFSGGVMPSAGLFHHFQEHWRIVDQWAISGLHYNRTSEAWLQRVDKSRPEILDLFREVYGEKNAFRWFIRWRIFFMACAELFGYDQGRQWGVSHYLFDNPAADGRIYETR